MAEEDTAGNKPTNIKIPAYGEERSGFFVKYMLQTKKIWLNGKIIDWNKAKIHILTHSLHYGSSIFEGIRAYQTEKGPAVFRLSDHLKRFFHSSSCLEMKLSFSKKEIEKAIFDLIKINKVSECYIRPIAFYGKKMGLYPEGASLNMAIAVWPWDKYLGSKPIKTIISSFIRLHPKSIISSAKIGGYYVNSIFASMEAKKKKADEAILLDYQGNIAEGPGENIFMVKNKKLYTPKTFSILPGITRESIIKIARNFKIPVYEKDIKPKELKSADEVFFVGTAAEVSPIGKIDNVLINKGEIGDLTNFFQETFNKIVHGKMKKYFKWLSYVN